MSKKSKIAKGICTYPNCRTPSEVIIAYIDEEYCDKHWDLHCQKPLPKERMEEFIRPKYNPEEIK